MGNPLLGYWQRLYEMTDAERALEPAIAALGERYRSQHPFWPLKIFADFALLDRKLVIEVDGSSHNKPSQRKKDLEHTMALQVLGWRVVRVTNEDATRCPADTVARALLRAAAPPPDYQAELARLLADFPAFAREPAKKPRRPRSRPKARGRKSAARSS